ncbi:receptor-like cytosolic serine/threonine-protein kinase RBK1 [Silene latifolia]|uniref:receptor-like cytosolic serine/threonine-protein kinase RBK1 n=1 Tax=Silene latifolia TaxID=37657 RepID=UPI003D76B196
MTAQEKQIEEKYEGAERDEMEIELNKQEIETSEPSASPRGVLDIPISSDSSSTSMSSTSSNNWDSSSIDKNGSDDNNNSNSSDNSLGTQWKGFIHTVKKKSGVRKLSSTTINLLNSYDISAKSICKKLARIRSGDDGIDCRLLPTPKPSWRNFGYSELATATDHFSPERLLGKGGHAEVYKGCLPDGSVVAVKRLTKKGEKQDEERTADFLSELGIIAHVDHPNTAKLIGFGIEAGFYLILQFAPNCSVESCLQDSSRGMNWQTRFRVALGVAEGLSYLHHTCQRRIIHRDIKASNILLSENYEPLISDFGLAKWLPENWVNHVVFPIEGTFGYLAPEYFMHGIADEKTDVFAYGVLLLEIITGRHAVAIDATRQSLVIWAKPFLDSMDMEVLVDPKLEDNYDTLQMKRIMMIASMCINHTASNRPYMNKVVELLKGEGGAFDLMKQESTAPRSILLDACDLEDYTCSNYLQDLNRHMELVME